MNSPARVSLDQLNSLNAAGFTQSLSGVFEHAPWVAEAARGSAPFSTVAALHEALMGAVRAAPHDRQLAFVKSHPELADRVAIASGLTAESKSEQGGLGLDRLSEEEFARFGKLNNCLLYTSDAADE